MSTPARPGLRPSQAFPRVREIGSLALVLAIAGCAISRRQDVEVTQPIDRVATLISIGCYACLAEAVQLNRLALSESPTDEKRIRQLQLALTLMAFRERELGLPNSGADRDATAIAWASPLPVEAFAMVLRHLEDRDKPIDTDSPASTDLNTTLTKLLEDSATRNVAVAYALALTCPASASSTVPAPFEWWVQLREANLSLRYAELSCSTSASEDDVSVFLQKDSRFAEVHYRAGIAALHRGQLVSAHERFALARQGLIHSSVVALALADVGLALARFEEALQLYTTAHIMTGHQSAELGKAKALTYLGRHVEAVAILGTLLDSGASNPGENYYWRAWNLYSLSQNGAAHADILEALRFWPSSHVERLAGLTARELANYDESRLHFSQALALDPGDCESRSYTAQLDAMARAWDKALGNLDTAAACFETAIADQEAELQAGVPRKSAAGELQRLQQWQASSLYGAAIVAKILGRRELALGYAKRLVGDPKLGGLARDFILDIDVPATLDHPSIGSIGVAKPPPA